VTITSIGGKPGPVLTGSRAHLRRPARPRTVPAPEPPPVDPAPDGCATVARPEAPWWAGDPSPEAWRLPDAAPASTVARMVATFARFEGRPVPPVPVAYFVRLRVDRRVEVLVALAGGGARGVAGQLLAYLEHVATLPARLAAHEIEGTRTRDSAPARAPSPDRGGSPVSQQVRPLAPPAATS
jgi:hypothetical protein